MFNIYASLNLKFIWFIWFLHLYMLSYWLEELEKFLNAWACLFFSLYFLIFFIFLATQHVGS